MNVGPEVITCADYRECSFFEPLAYRPRVSGVGSVKKPAAKNCRDKTVFVARLKDDILAVYTGLH